jgi:hypothetical protein
VNAIAAIQYALFRHPNSPVFGGTAAARCTAAIRLPDNPALSKSGSWWADSVSSQTFAESTPQVSPGGAITYGSGVGIDLYGNTISNARSSLRDNGNREDPFTNLTTLREPQMYGTLMECRAQVASPSSEALYFIGFGATASTTSDLSGIQRMCGFVCSGAANNWRAVVKRNTTPGSAPSTKTKDTTLGLLPSSFHNLVLEVSGGGESARWRASTGAWTNNKIPIVTTAPKSELLSRRGEGPVLWGAETRETAVSFAVPSTIRMTRLSMHAWRPGFVGTKPVFRK